MAPKGMKRPAGVEAEKLGTVAKALKSSPEHGFSMLAGMLSSSLGVPKVERHDYQVSIVGMVEEAIMAIDAGKKVDVVNLKSEVAECPGSKEKRAAAVEDAKKELESLKEAVEAKKTELAADTKAFAAADEALDAAKQAQKAGDKELAKVDAKKVGIEKVAAGSLTVLKDNFDKKALKEVLKLGRDLKLDASLMKALPDVVKKPKESRSAFEDTSFHQVESLVATEIEALAAKIKEEEPAKATRAEVVQAAEAAAQAAKKKTDDADEAFAGAKSAQKAGEHTLKDKEKSSAHWLMDSRKTMDSYDAAMTAQAEFATVLAALADLKELEPPPEPVAEEPTVEEPAAEAPAAPAEEAAAAA